ncbi:hypothetical protein LPB303_00160 [Polaribacter atrinae]|uniref:Uncharacterized protein n=1 Tax=Polaribacter atrinae TaxID=1333662 RepID=A0A176TFV1_9FLAO|nr:hypothetical protein LPB303_00160 [Polaribacter atrinae]
MSSLLPPHEMINDKNNSKPSFLNFFMFFKFVTCVKLESIRVDYNTSFVVFIAFNEFIKLKLIY